MIWEDILKNEEELPEHVKRARERVKQGLPSIEQPLIPQFDDEKKVEKEMNPDDIREKISDHVETIIQDIEKLNIKMGILSTRDPKPQDEIDQLKEEVKALYQQAIKVAEAEKRFEGLSEELQ